jgi:hypothetical protein
MRKQDKIKNIEKANKKLLREFDADTYQETEDNGYNRLAEYLQPLVDQELIHSDIRDEILGLASSYADDMWREGAQGGFAPK